MENRIKHKDGTLITAAAAAKRIGCTKQTILNWSRWGLLNPAYRMGKMFLFVESEVLRAATLAQDENGRGRPRTGHQA